MTGAPPPRPSEGHALRVVTFNIRNGLALDGLNIWWCRRRRVVATLLRLDPDLVALQEVYGFQARWLRRRLPRFGAYGVGRTDGRGRGEQVLVLYRRDRLELSEASTRWFGPDPDRPGTRLPGATFPRAAAIVRLDDRNTGGELTFVNTHLDADVASNRAASARQLAAWVAGDRSPLIVAGDLNESPTGDAVRTLRAEAGLRSALGPDAGGSNHDFTGRTDGRRIDHVLVSPHWTVLASWVDHRRVGGRLASDHWPVGADVELRTSPPAA